MYSRHTPGPWQIKRGGNFLQVEREGWAICSMEHVEQYRKLDARKDRTAFADARLIAAAPELLDAALWCLKMAKIRNEATGHENYEVGILERAIAKATGGSK
jgi:hypothetical protein